MSEKSIIVEISGVGPALFEKSRRARNISISLKSSELLRVAVPQRVSFEKARKIILSDLKWVHKYSARMKKWRKEHQTLKKNVIDVCGPEAAVKLTDRLIELARQYGFRYNKISIRKQKTRWGSCSSRNNISLNIKLARLPDELADYVILHELVHTRVRSHKARFWAELTRIRKDAKTLDLRLRKYNLAFL